MNAVDKLSSQDFYSHFTNAYHSRLQDLIILQEVASTNDYLFELDAPKFSQALVCMAEQQTAGKGTKGRVWQSELGASFIYSIAYSFYEEVQDLSALSLAIGVITQGVLDDYGFAGVQLKWPNDLQFQEKKLGGVLVEVKKTDNHLFLVCGIGLNVKNTLNAEKIDQPFTALDQIDGHRMISRTEIAAKLTAGLLNLFSQYPKSGFKAWQKQWESVHAYQNKKLRVLQNNHELFGYAHGVAEDGALLIKTDLGLQKIISADVFSD